MTKRITKKQKLFSEKIQFILSKKKPKGAKGKEAIKRDRKNILATQFD